MMETVIHDADATLEFIQWVDGVTPDMTREEVFTRLKEQMDNLLRDVPKELEEIIAKLLKNSEESLKVEHALISISDNATNGDADAYEAAYDELFLRTSNLGLPCVRFKMQSSRGPYNIGLGTWSAHGTTSTHCKVIQKSTSRNQRAAFQEA